MTMETQQYKKELIEQLESLSEDVDSNIAKAEELHGRFSSQHKLYRETAGNDDGNEDHPETYDEDGDNVQGAERSEELSRLADFVEEAPDYYEKIDGLKAKVEQTDEPEALEDLVEEIDELERNFEDARPEDLD